MDKKINSSYRISKNLHHEFKVLCLIQKKEMSLVIENLIKGYVEGSSNDEI